MISYGKIFHERSIHEKSIQERWRIPSFESAVLVDSGAWDPEALPSAHEVCPGLYFGSDAGQDGCRPSSGPAMFGSPLYLYRMRIEAIRTSFSENLPNSILFCD